MQVSSIENKLNINKTEKNEYIELIFTLMLYIIIMYPELSSLEIQDKIFNLENEYNKEELIEMLNTVIDEYTKNLEGEITELYKKCIKNIVLYWKKNVPENYEAIKDINIFKEYFTQVISDIILNNENEINNIYNYIKIEEIDNRLLDKLEKKINIINTEEKSLSSSNSQIDNEERKKILDKKIEFLKYYLTQENMSNEDIKIELKKRGFKIEEWRKFLESPNKKVVENIINKYENSNNKLLLEDVFDILISKENERLKEFNFMREKSHNSLINISKALDILYEIKNNNINNINFFNDEIKSKLLLNKENVNELYNILSVMFINKFSQFKLFKIFDTDKYRKELEETNIKLSMLINKNKGEKKSDKYIKFNNKNKEETNIWELIDKYNKIREHMIEKQSKFKLFDLFKSNLNTEQKKIYNEIQFLLKAYMYKFLNKKKELLKIKDKLPVDFYYMLNNEPLYKVKEYIYSIANKKTIQLKNPFLPELKRRRMRHINPKINEIYIKNIDECILIHKLKPWLTNVNRMNSVYFISHPEGISKDKIQENDQVFYGSILQDNMYIPTKKFWELHCIENHNKSCNYENMVLTFTSTNKKFIHGIFNTKTKEKHIFTDKDYKKECEWMNTQKDSVLLQLYLKSDIQNRHRSYVRDIFGTYNILFLEEKIYQKNKNKKLGDYLLDVAKINILYREDNPIYIVAEETRKMINEGFYEDVMMFIPLFYVLENEDKNYMINFYNVNSSNIAEEIAVKLYNKDNFKQLYIKPKTVSEFGKHLQIINSDKVPLYKNKLSEVCNNTKDNFYILENGQIKCINYKNYKNFNIEAVNKYFLKKYKNLTDIIYSNIYELVKDNKESYKEEFETIGEVEEIEIQIEKVEKQLNMKLTQEEKQNILINLNFMFKENFENINKDIIRLINLDIEQYKVKYEMDLENRLGEKLNSCYSIEDQEKYNSYINKKNEINKIITSRLVIFEDIIKYINKKYPSTKNYIMLYTIVQFISEYLENYKPVCDMPLDCYICKKNNISYKTVLLSDKDFMTAYICSDTCFNKLKDTEKSKKNLTYTLIKNLMEKLTIPYFDIKKYSEDLFGKTTFSEEQLIDYLRYYKLIMPSQNEETEYALKNLCDMFKINFIKKQNYYYFVMKFQELLFNKNFWSIYESLIQHPPENLLNMEHINKVFIGRVLSISLSLNINNDIIKIANTIIKNNNYTNEQLIDFIITSPYWKPPVSNSKVLTSIFILYFINNINLPYHSNLLWSRLFTNEILNNYINKFSRFDKPVFDIPLTKLPNINTRTINPLDNKNYQAFETIKSNLYIVNDCIIVGKNITDFISNFSNDLYNKMLDSYKQGNTFMINKDILYDFYHKSVKILGCEIDKKELNHENKKLSLLSNITKYFKAIINKQDLPSIKLPNNFNEIKARKMSNMFNNDIDIIINEIKIIFRLEQSNYITNFEIFYSKLWDILKYHLYVSNKNMIDNIEKDEYITTITGMFDQKNTNDGGLFSDEEEDVKEIDYDVENVKKVFNKFIQSFESIGVRFVNIFTKYSKDTNHLQVNDLFYEEPKNEEPKLVQGNDDNGDDDGDGNNGNDDGNEDVDEDAFTKFLLDKLDNDEIV